MSIYPDYWENGVSWKQLVAVGILTILLFVAPFISNYFG